ncbi:uncharacterized protein LOC116162618 [Photinus pyralis]|uniref:uncharacterized protein LOC116162618 n=1 Tax=Photinus pyralis TaxID=7054 RepID=UPI0012676F20|nr:uncharacterized protein LOC116162618 [Photinus pyralis]
MTWDINMNKTVMRCYYKTTKLETKLTGYKQEMHTLFIAEYPHLAQSVTQQRVIDQKRAIVQNETHLIKEEIAQEIHTQPAPQHVTQTDTRIDPQEDTITVTPQENTLTHETQINTPTQKTHNPTTSQAQYADLLTTEMETNIALWTGTDPTKRETLPKLIFKKETKQLINLMNHNIISQYVTEDSNLEELHLVTYAAAKTVLACNGQFTKQTVNLKLTSTKQKKPKWQQRIETKINKLRRDIGRIT